MKYYSIYKIDGEIGMHVDTVKASSERAALREYLKTALSNSIYGCHIERSAFGCWQLKSSNGSKWDAHASKSKKKG